MSLPELQRWYLYFVFCDAAADDGEKEEKKMNKRMQRRRPFY